MSKFSEKLQEVNANMNHERMKLDSPDRVSYDIRLGKMLKELRSAAESDVNCFGYRPAELAQQAIDVTEAQKFLTAIAIQWVTFWAGEGQSHTDGRNEIAAARCLELSGTAEFQEFEDEQDVFSEEWRVASLFVGESLMMHKTLMQSFTAVILAVLAKLSGNDSFATRFPLI